MRKLQRRRKKRKKESLRLDSGLRIGKRRERSRLLSRERAMRNKKKCFTRRESSQERVLILGIE
jgi:hypothetical protein